MRIVKAAVIGLALVAFSGSAAFAQAGCGSSKSSASAQTIKPGTKQSTMSSDAKHGVLSSGTKQTTVSSDTKK